MILRATNGPASTRVWATGSEGERLIGAGLDAIDERIAITLHDRRIPRSRANIDHITIARSGVFVIDSKRYSGRLELRQAGPLWMRERRLYIGGRDKTKLVEAMAKQTAAVREAIQPLLEEFELPLTPVLCFLGVEGSASRAPVRDQWRSHRVAPAAEEATRAGGAARARRAATVRAQPRDGATAGVKLPEPSFPLLSERTLMRRPTGRGSGWMNVKHRHYRRFGQELERAYRRRQRVALV